MDPDACLKRLLNACRDHYRDEAEEAARDLLRWIESGGFLPSDPREDLKDKLALALPYVESAADDPAHKPEPVKKLAAQIRALVT